MKIKWLGHASFVITAGDGTRVIMDPYTSGKEIAYSQITEEANFVTVSHDHFDHNNVPAIAGQPEVVRDTGMRVIKGIEVKGIATSHDEVDGSKRGRNTVFALVIDGIHVCHLGDIGHRLTKDQAHQIGHVDVLLIPVGGVYTVEVRVASQICEDLRPTVIIPMHYKTAKTNLPIGGVDEFLRGKANIRKPASSELELKLATLPSKTEIVVLTPAL